MVNLKQCPFCGGDAQLISGGPGNHFIKCTSCSATSDDRSLDSTIKAWNLRTHNSDSAEPVAWLTPYFENDPSGKLVPIIVSAETTTTIPEEYKPLYLASPPAKEVTEAKKFPLGARVTKKSGSSWTGLVVGFYTTKLTPIGYAVESENEPGSVQIYPETALTNRTPDDEVGNG